MADIVKKTRLRYGLSKVTAGLNALPDWIENEQVKLAPTGAPGS